MTTRFVVTGTDTGVGKTVFSAALAGALDGAYWKPIQSGIAPEADAETVARLSGLPRDRILPEAYRLTAPLSPHRAAELDGVTIDTQRLNAPPTGRPLIIEGAGGLMVPITRQTLQIELYAWWGLPVILVARTALGTINHSLLSLAAMRSHGVKVHGIAFVGEGNEDSERCICDFGNVKRLGRLPHLKPLDAQRLGDAFRDSFRSEDFLS